jgi:hypothetical protein
MQNQDKAQVFCDAHSSAFQVIRQVEEDFLRKQDVFCKTG